MNNKFFHVFCFITIFSLYAYPSVHAQGYAKVVRDLDCGTFRGRAETLATKPPDLFSHVARQTIRIIIPGKRGSVALDLHQKRSPDTDLGGRLQLDGTAYSWRCVLTKTGKSYLYVAFYCNNSDAKTCHHAMDQLGNEWDQIYDPKGRGFFKDPQNMTDNDMVRLHKWDLYDEMFGTHETTSIYSRYNAGKQIPP